MKTSVRDTLDGEVWGSETTYAEPLVDRGRIYPQPVHDFESVGRILSRLADMKEPAPSREPDRWDLLAIGFFAGIFLTTALVLAISYFGR